MYNYWNYNKAPYNQSATYELVATVPNMSVTFNDNNSNATFYPTDVSVDTKTYTNTWFRRVEE